jgi:thioredoxin 1
MSGYRFARNLAAAIIAGLLWVNAGCDDHSAMNQSSASVKHITPDEFGSDVLHSAQPVMVDFYATWCAPCRAFAPVLDRVAGDYAGRINFVKVNLDEVPAIAQEYQVAAIPTELFFKDGKLVDRTLGAMDEAGLRQKLDAIVGTIPAQAKP